MDPSEAIRRQYDDASNLEARIALHRAYSIATTPWHDWVREHIGPLDGPRVLEVGCGSGALWQGTDAPDSLTLVDRSQGMVETSLGVVPSARGVCSDVVSMPFDEGEFDVVIANHVLYHVADLYRALEEIRRVLAPGGRFFAATNGANHMRELEEASVAYLGAAPWRPELAPGDFWLETGDDLLPSFFPEVSLHTYEDGLRVDDVEPLLAYVLSVFTPEDRSRVAPRVGHFCTSIAKRMAEDGGVFYITKSSGLFEARKPREGEARRREAARLILLDEDDRVFLFHGRNLDRTRSFWVMPGGGLAMGEDLVAGARRELLEETGIGPGDATEDEAEDPVDLGPPVWTRVHTFPWVDGLTEQHETYFVVRVPADRVTAPLGDDYTFDHRWWSLAEIQQSREIFVPRRLATLLAALLCGEVPSTPVDDGP